LVNITDGGNMEGKKKETRAGGVEREKKKAKIFLELNAEMGQVRSSLSLELNVR